MKKLIITILLLFNSVCIFGQITAVTATITDSDSTVWINPQWSVQFVPNPNFPNLNSYSINGVTITSNIYNQYIQVSGTGNSSGVINTTLLDNGQVLPAGSTYRWVVQSQTSAPATTYEPIKITGSSQSLTSYLSTGSIAPRFSATANSFGYADIEISVTPQPGGGYYNVINLINRLWSGSAWTNGGGGSTAGSNAPLNIVPVEAFGAVADSTGAVGNGTNNTTPFQNAINSLQSAGKCGQILLKAGKYRIATHVSITSSCVGIAGSSYGAISTTQSNQLSANMPASAIYIDSATEDAIDATGGSINTPISFNKFNDFTIMRTVADTGTGTGCALVGSHAGAAGLSIQYAGGFVVDRVWSEDSACPFYFQNAGAYGTGYVSNSGALWAANGFNPIVPVYGFVAYGLNSMESFRLRDSFAQTLYPGYAGVQSVGLFVTGPQINDIFIKGFETAFVTYGEYIQYTGSSVNTVGNSDIHLIDCVNDTFFQSGITVYQLVNSQAAEVEIKGGWNSTSVIGSSNSSSGINIVGSSGVTITAVGFINLATSPNGQNYGIVVTGPTSNRIAITGNNFYNMTTNAIQLNSANGVAVTGNIIQNTSAFSAAAMIKGVSLTRSSIAGNALSGFATTGISLDSGSSNNDVEGLSSIDPTNITTPYSNAGASNGIAQTVFLPTAIQTTVSCSTSGTAKFSQPDQGSSSKRVIIHLTACLGTASYTYPTVFINTPSVFASNNVAASVASTVSTTAVTVTGTTSTGSLVLEDY